jgi:hypothetical protein
MTITATVNETPRCSTRRLEYPERTRRNVGAGPARFGGTPVAGR